LKQYERAIADYDKAIALEPEDAVAYYNRGVSYLVLEQYERAIEDYDKAIELKPDYADAYNNRGLSYSLIKETQRALFDYDKAIEIDPNNSEVYYNRGNSYTDLKQYERAIADYDKAMEIEPSLAGVYRNRGNSNAGLGEFERAIADYDKAIEIMPVYIEAYINRGISYARMEEFARAIDDFTKAIGLQPENSSAYALRSMIYTNINKFDVAIVDIKRAISYDKNQEIYLDIFSDIVRKKFKLENNQTTEGKSEALRNKREKLFKGSFIKTFLLWLILLIIFFLSSNPQLLTLFTCSGSFDASDLNPISEFSFTAISITTIALITPWIWQVRIATNETMVHTQAELNINFDERFAQLGASKSFDSINVPKLSTNQPLNKFSILDS
jgi:tetratricopeptide (TPR) repeat protein